jgi:nucleoside-diphosphate-sugar epimerase
MRNCLISAQELESLRNRCDFSIYSDSKVLITGGAGMIGSWLANSLVQISSETKTAPNVTVLSRRSTPRNLRDIWDRSNFRYVQSSVEDSNLDSYDFIFHCASAASPTQYQNGEKILEANLKGAEQLIQASPNLKKFIFLSSGEVYGTNPPLHMEENFVGDFADNLNRSAYPKAKIATEKFIEQAALGANFNSAIIRLFHTFGPGLSPHDGRSFADFVWSVADNKSPVLHSAGEQVRAFLYLEDSIAGILTAAGQMNSTIVNVGSDIPMSIRDFAQSACEVSDLDLSPQFDIEVSTSEQSPIGVSVPSNSLLKTFGWNQQYSVSEALKRTIDWAKLERSENNN